MHPPEFTRRDSVVGHRHEDGAGHLAAPHTVAPVAPCRLPVQLDGLFGDTIQEAAGFGCMQCTAAGSACSAHRHAAHHTQLAQHDRAPDAASMPDLSIARKLGTAMAGTRALNFDPPANPHHAAHLEDGLVPHNALALAPVKDLVLHVDRGASQDKVCHLIGGRPAQDSVQAKFPAYFQHAGGLPHSAI